MTVLGLMDEQNAHIKALRVFPRMDYKGLSLHADEEHAWMQSGEPLEQMSDFLDVIRRIRS